MKRSPFLAFSILALAAHAHADSDTRKVGGFTAIELAGTIVVDAHIGAAKVEVEGDADVIPLVTTSVKDGTLLIDTKPFPKNKQIKKLVVHVTAPDISRITISGTGELSLDGVASKALAVSIPGTGEVQMSGKTSTLTLDVGGTGAIKANKLVAEAITMKVPGTIQATLHATKAFESDVSGTAAVRVRGNPKTVRKSTTGTAMIDVR